MQEQRRKVVANFMETTSLSMKVIASTCGVTLKITYNIKERIVAGEKLKHKGGAGPKAS